MSTSTGTSPRTGAKGRTRRSSDLVFAVLVLLLGVVALVGGLVYGLEQEDRVGPGAMPAAAGALIVIPALLQIRRELRSLRSDDREHDDADPDAPQTRRVVVLFLLIALSVALTYVIGMLISVSLLVGALFILDNPRKPWVGAIAAVVAALFGWGVFEVLLEVPLPRGFLNLL